MKLIRSKSTLPAPTTKETPDQLSHYTTVAGAKGIIESSSFWASNVSYLNDREELTHALKSTEGAMKSLMNNKKLEGWLPLVNEVITELKGTKIPDTYAVCFCSDSDNLSQWRDYGGNTQGICLNFETNALRKFLHGSSATIHKISYTDRTTARKFSEELISELSEIIEFDELLGSSEQGRREEIFKTVSRLLACFKHLGFRDEREWRAVIQKSLEPTEINFRAVTNKIVPYICLSSPNAKLPLKSITIGPGYDQDLTARSLDLFLQTKGFEKIQVAESRVPFRPEPS